MSVDHRRRARGSALIYCMIAMVAVTGLTTLAVDVSHVRVVKTQLQGAADASARAGAALLGSDPTVVQYAIVTAARETTADGTAVVVDPATDVDFGTWSGGTFAVVTGSGRSAATALRVRCVRAADRGTAVPALFARMFNVTSSDLTAVATTTGTAPATAGYVGLNSITSGTSAFAGGYRSSTTLNPSPSSCDTGMSVGSNGVIRATSGTYYGDAVLGPSGSTSGLTFLGTIKRHPSAIPPPAVPAWVPGTNPGGVPQAYVVGSQTTLPGGTYWFTSLTLNASLIFSGPSVLHVNGSVTFGSVGATLKASSKRPADLTVYGVGTGNFTGGDNAFIIGKVTAPAATLTVGNNFQLMGAATFKQITAGSTCRLYYDEDLGPSGGGNVNSVATVQ